MPILDDLEAFESPKLLIEGARKRIDDFETIAADFVKACNYTVFKKPDPKTGQNVGIIRLNSRLPGQARTLFSGIVIDLRHALDQAVCDASFELGATNVSGTHFPFAKNRSEIAGQMKKVCAKVPVDLHVFLEHTQPYMGGDDFLWGVSSVAGPAKHRKIINVAPLAGGMILHSDGLHVDGPATFGISKMSDLRNEYEFVRYPGTSEFRAKFDVPIRIVIGDIDVVGGQEALPVLHEYARKVEGIVLGIEAETARILRLRAG